MASKDTITTKEVEKHVEEEVETKATITNVVVSDNTDRINEDKDNEKETLTDLGVSMDKLNLGPKKKLLVLSITGFLVHRAHRSRPNSNPKNRKHDFRLGNYKIYKRPFCEEFLKFCFERFEVGIWSSTIKNNIGGLLSNVFGGELKSKLLFTWDQNQCTKTEFMCLDNKGKPLFLKDPELIWKAFNGGYSTSNTLLISDPIKALLNPPNTSISPRNYDPKNKEDDVLGPNGELRVFLDGLDDVKDVQSYVKAHPIGYPAITSSHVDWDYYSNIIRVMSTEDLPNQQPIINLPMVEPVIDQPLDDHSIDQPMVEPAIDQPLAEHAIDQPMVEPAIDQPMAEHAIDQPMAEPAITLPSINQPLAKHAIDQPMAEPAIDQPMVEHAIDLSLAEHAIEPSINQPMAEPVTNQPMIKPATNQPMITPALRRSTRLRKMPTYLNDYVIERKK